MLDIRRHTSFFEEPRQVEIIGHFCQLKGIDEARLPAVENEDSNVLPSPSSLRHLLE